MEFCRNSKPDINFLKSVRNITSKKNIVLIFDECTTGFRENLGGIHLKYKIYPDMCVLGKTLGNGYAITAIVGKDEVMKYGNETFISSTFWTERGGFVAGLKTLEIMEKYHQQNGTFFFQPTIASNNYEVIFKCIRAVKKYKENKSKCLRWTYIIPLDHWKIIL